MKSGTKGAADVVEDLLAAPEITNLAVVMQRRLHKLECEGELTSHTLVKLASQIRRAIKAGRHELETPRRALRRLKEASASTSRKVPIGF
jgi:hypothetical protein